MRGHVLDALSIDPDLAAIANALFVLLARADHHRLLVHLKRR
jgi:hypothetical protein